MMNDSAQLIFLPLLHYTLINLSHLICIAKMCAGTHLRRTDLCISTRLRLATLGATSAW